MGFNILVVDDENDIRELVSGILEDNGYDVDVAKNYTEAVESLKRKRPNLVILDVWLGDSDRDGLRLLEFIKKDYDYVPVVMMSGHGTIETAVSAIRHGAYDFMEKPFNSNRLLTSVEKAIENSKLQMENDELKIKAKIPSEILGRSQNVINIRQAIEKIAPLGGRCIIIGAVGSDKEIIAKEIHRLSARAKNAFGTLSCRSYGVRQLEEELFGTEVLTESTTLIKRGLLEKINGGTLFIEDLSSTSLEFQQKFLKILKDDYFVRIGSKEKIDVNIRVIAGFSQDINKLTKAGKFSDELYCRLNANVIKVSPLKARREDIAYLLDYFMEKAAKALNMQPKKFSSDALGVLNSYPWPGDVMQMKNMVDWILTVAISESEEGNIVTLSDLPREITEGKSTVQNMQFISTVSELSIREAREAFEKEYFLEQLKRFSGNISLTAKFVGMERSALHRKLKSLDIVDLKSFKCGESE
ncbi:MAG: sigma-54 dependent transcriptional regulator [Holosporales bacterium]|jgi:two-component system nitrogen regulation response regulator NtrX|nr:sigma-54 dependent transcriptional regulator [Holosporales bacterium]